MEKKPLLCKLGIHKFKKIHENSYSNEMLRRLAVQKVKAQRKCLRCSKLQEQEIHCLGLNPPKYIREWIDIKSNWDLPGSICGIQRMAIMNLSEEINPNQPVEQFLRILVMTPACELNRDVESIEDLSYEEAVYVIKTAKALL